MAGDGHISGFMISPNHAAPATEKRKPGQPQKGATAIVRLKTKVLKGVDKWASAFDPALPRTEAIKNLLQVALTSIDAQERGLSPLVFGLSAQEVLALDNWIAENAPGTSRCEAMKRILLTAITR